ncbi:hypothetical protein D3C75_701280 [compost metagenome]
MLYSDAGLSRTLFHGANSLKGISLQLLNNVTNFLDGITGVARKIAYFVSHYCETTPCLSRPSSLDCSIEREKVGLLSNCLNHLEDVTDALATAG